MPRSILLAILPSPAPRPETPENTSLRKVSSRVALCCSASGCFWLLLVGTTAELVDQPEALGACPGGEDLIHSKYLLMELRTFARAESLSRRLLVYCRLLAAGIDGPLKILRQTAERKLCRTIQALKSRASLEVVAPRVTHRQNLGYKMVSVKALQIERN